MRTIEISPMQDDHLPKGSNGLLPEIVIKNDELCCIEILNFLKLLHWNAFIVGPGVNDMTFKTTGWTFSLDKPSIVLCQARQSADSADYGWPDQFSIQVIETGKDFVTIRIHRVDSNDGWGQDLRIDILAIG